MGSMTDGLLHRSHGGTCMAPSYAEGVTVSGALGRW